VPHRIIRKVNGRALAGALVGSILVLLGGLALAYVTNHRAVHANTEQIKRVNTALAALCIQRVDLDTHISNTHQLLQDTRGEATVFGIPRIVIIESQRQNLILRRSLSILECG